VQVTARSGRRVIASTRSDADGRYRFNLKSGPYTIIAAPAKAFPRCPPQQVEVVAGQTIAIDIRCDTGIR
jgi:hypothetical protein